MMNRLNSKRLIFIKTQWSVLHRRSFVSVSKICDRYLSHTEKSCYGNMTIQFRFPTRMMTTMEKPKPSKSTIAEISSAKANLNENNKSNIPLPSNHHPTTAKTIFSLTSSPIPPFPVRVGIVSASVGLATPLFATLGATQIWYHYLPKTVIGQYMKYGTSILISGGGVSFIYNYFIPFLSNHAEIILPFALANAIASGFWYSLAELSIGYESLVISATTATTAATITSSSTISQSTKQSLSDTFIQSLTSLFKPSNRLPFIGTGIGILTVFTSPLLWPLSFHICFLNDPILSSFLQLNDVTWLVDLYSWILIPVALPIGIFSGMSLHTVLQPILFINSNNNSNNSNNNSNNTHMPWTYRSLPILLGLILSSILYFTLCRSSSDTYCYEERMDHITGEVYSLNILTNELLFDDGDKAYQADMKRKLIASLQLIKQYVPSFIQNFMDSPKRRRKNMDSNNSNNNDIIMNGNDISKRTATYLDLLSSASLNMNNNIHNMKDTTGDDVVIKTINNDTSNPSNHSTHPLLNINYCKDRQVLVTLTDLLLHYIYSQRQYKLHQYSLSLSQQQIQQQQIQQQQIQQQLQQQQSNSSSVTPPPPPATTTAPTTASSHTNININMSNDTRELRRLESSLSKLLLSFANEYCVDSILPNNNKNSITTTGSSSITTSGSSNSSGSNSGNNNEELINMIESLLDCIDVELTAMMKNKTVNYNSNGSSSSSGSINNANNSNNGSQSANLQNFRYYSATASANTAFDQQHQQDKVNDKKTNTTNISSYIAHFFRGTSVERPITIHDWLLLYHSKLQKLIEDEKKQSSLNYYFYPSNSSSNNRKKQIQKFSKLLFAVALLKANLDFYEFELKSKVYYNDDKD